MYTGEARWEWLRRIKEEAGLSIPLIGNGDATTPERVRDMFAQTGVDAVMIGRGAIGNPWIFRDTKALLETGELPPAPSWSERVVVVAEHLALKCAWLGERKGVMEMRRMYGGYFKARAGASELRARLVQAETQAEVLEILLNAPEREAGVHVTVSAAVRGVPVRLPPTNAARASRHVARAA
jgi:tRNA-dihydrouridine synthase